MNKQKVFLSAWTLLLAVMTIAQLRLAAQAQGETAPGYRYKYYVRTSDSGAGANTAEVNAIFEDINRRLLKIERTLHIQAAHDAAGRVLAHSRPFVR